MFKAAGGWIFKHFFDDSAIFWELADHYNKNLYRFEFKTIGERNKAIKLLELRGFDVELVEEDDILKGFPPRFRTWASHAEQVSVLPPQFQRLATSRICDIEAMRHQNKPLYGVQWHPEVVHTEYGGELLDNFINICKS